MKLESRRNFLKAGSLALVSTVAAPVMAVPTPEPQKWDEEYDLVIIGAGGAGLAGAVEAVQKGLKTVVIEKEPIVGGSSIICGGAWAVADTDYQREKGVKDSDDIFFKDMMKTGGNVNDSELVKALVKGSKAHYDWVTKERGVLPKALVPAAGMSVPRAHTFMPPEVIGTMKNYAQEKGAKILLGTKVERLVWDDSKKQIAGVKASRRGKTVYFKAKKGVLLAAGGFSRNPQMLGKYSPPMARAAVIAGLGTQGDGILMALAYGAEMLDTTYVKATYGFKVNPSTIKDLSLIYYSGAIMVNKESKRFVNESLSYKLLGDLALSQEDAMSFLVFDDAIRTTQMGKRLIDKALWSPYDQGKEVDFAYRATTLEEVAKKAGLDPVALKATVDKYNRYVEQGSDPEFGRNSLSSGFGQLVKIEKGPFYIFPATAAMIGTYCGIKVNSKAQAIDVFGEPIKHLYAAGELIGGVHGSAYMTGTAFAKAMVFGRIAAKNIAEEN